MNLKVSKLTWEPSLSAAAWVPPVKNHCYFEHIFIHKLLDGLVMSFLKINVELNFNSKWWVDYNVIYVMKLLGQTMSTEHPWKQNNYYILVTHKTLFTL